MITRRQVCIWTISMSWILVFVVNILLIKSCGIKYEVIPQTIQIESFTYNGETYEYVKEFSYYDKERNIHTITSNLFIDPNAGDCSCGIDYNYMKDGDKNFKETCGQLKKLSTKQKFRIESEHLWYTENSWMILITIFIVILGLTLALISSIRISNRLDYREEYDCCCYGCKHRCCENAKCIWGKLVDDEGCEKINKFFGFM